MPASGVFRGKTSLQAGDNSVETVDSPLGESGVDAQGAELRPPPAPEILTRSAVELLQGIPERGAEQLGGLVVIGLRSAFGLEHDPVDHAQFEAVRSVGLERLRGLPSLR